ncbi:nuclear transport factor 2 family protein [Rhodococcus aetherivorans]|uniref:nuclear transport factor 2 family protein n=1 Tax=Rhodococcus aetherivorans TaxID=191292 RepID=UPI0002D22BC0|nr:nuclear transport factor 2 family protein [Rhodococcus aetherivorans]WFS15702.1 nuclear transport factor 2 family protein [Rhodococcus aetherivorans]CCW14569.1 putative 3-ketosteroid 5-isomerase [Rhodococcus aetherivorans]
MTTSGTVTHAERIRATVVEYLAAVADGSGADIAALYAEDATLEDPVGSAPRTGRAAIAEFYRALEGSRRATELLALRVTGSCAAFHFRVVTETGGRVHEVEPIDVMTFDDQARITSMCAYWAPSDMRQR